MQNRKKEENSCDIFECLFKLPGSSEGASKGCKKPLKGLKQEQLAYSEELSFACYLLFFKVK